MRIVNQVSQLGSVSGKVRDFVEQQERFFKDACSDLFKELGGVTVFAAIVNHLGIEYEDVRHVFEFMANNYLFTDSVARVYSTVGSVVNAFRNYAFSQIADKINLLG